MSDYGINTGKVLFIGLLSVILTSVVVVGLQALYYWQVDRMQLAEQLWEPSAKMEKLTAAQQARLTDYRMLDAKKGTVAIPVSRAMEMVVTELSRPGGEGNSKGTVAKERKNEK
ncbi:MAG: hypothetical protein JXM70_25675 [Pirellulales bacterium]|nr:hypothetical protein [Pirellulales bacterium]